ncbi:uncharacterized protein LOC144433715 [Glandiceps talaboti]
MASENCSTPNISNEIIIALIGVCKSGKSSTGNTILGTHTFDAKRSSIATTKKTMHGRRPGDPELVVIDTPPIPTLGDKHTQREFGKCIMGEVSEAGGLGIDAVILTININDRFTQDHEKAVNMLFSIYGDDITKYLILLFTRMDQLEQDTITFEQFTHELPISLKELISKCNKRMIAFDNTNSKTDSQVKDFLHMVGDMKGENCGKRLLMTTGKNLVRYDDVTCCNFL